MKIPDNEKEVIINGLLEILDPEAVEVIEELREVSGRDLINVHGVYKTEKGAQVLPGLMYTVSTSEYKKLNHPQRIGQIIADSSNREDMQEKLGMYLAKYAKDPAAVVQSIPVHLSLKNIRQNEN